MDIDGRLENVTCVCGVSVADLQDDYQHEKMTVLFCVIIHCTVGCYVLLLLLIFKLVSVAACFWRNLLDQRETNKQNHPVGVSWSQ